MSLSRSLQYAFLAIIVTTVGFSLYQWNASRASTQKTAPNNGLVGYWSFNEGTGTQAGDASGNNNTGTLTNGPTWVTGKLGQALNFDGVDDYVNVPSPVITGYPATITAWVKVPSGAPHGGYPVSITSSGGYSGAFAIGAFPTVVSGFTSNGADSNVSISVDTTQWTFVSFVLTNATSRTLYVNNLTPVTDTSDKTPAGLDVLNIGRVGGYWSPPYTSNSNPFLGQVDEVRIYNRALSGTEITNLYNLGAEKLNVSPVSNLTSGLVGYWTFDGKDTPWSSSSAGTATDRSGNSNTGTLTNMSRATSPAEGKLGQALNFDGVDEYVDIPSSASLCPTSISVSFWMKLNSLTTTTYSGGASANEMYPLSRGNSSGLNDGYTFYFNNTYGIAFAINSYLNSASYLNSSFVVGKWYFVTGTYDGSNIKIYIDGNIQGTTAYAGGPVDCAGTLFIGRRCPASSYNAYFNGSIDEVRIYNRALSAGEIQSLYDLGASDKVNSSVSQNQGTGRLDSGLAGYWKLDDASGTTATDSSTNANNGTLTNGPTWGTGRIGGAVDFNGTKYITIPNSTPLQVTGNMTVSFWMYMRSYAAAGNWNPIINKFSSDANNEFNIRYIESYSAQFYTGTGGGLITWDPAADAGLNTWVHVVARRNLNTGVMDMWFNGVKKRSGAAGSAVSSTTQPLQLGAGPNGGWGGAQFDGLFDEVRVYNRALSDEEISQLYRLTTPTGVDTSLKGYWSFNGPDVSGTTAYDRSGSANNGTLTNGPTITEGKLGQALTFDGVNDYVDVGSGPSNLDTISVSAWIKSTSGGAIVSNRYTSTSYGTWYVLNSGMIELGDNSNGDYIAQNFATAVNNGLWHHIVYTKAGTTHTVYVDGVRDANFPITKNVDISQIAPTFIGMKWTYNYDGIFRGLIDEVRIYNRALSSTEVSALYNAGR